MAKWRPPEKAIYDCTVVLLYKNLTSTHINYAKRPEGATSWHNPYTGVEIARGQNVIGWLRKSEAIKEGIIVR